MKTKLIYISSFVILLFTSCEGYKVMTGTVISEKTGMPIPGAEIVVKNGQAELIKTDSSGKFLINSGFTSMMFGGPKFIFKVRKEGYSEQLIKKRNGDITVKLTEKE